MSKGTNPPPMSQIPTGLKYTVSHEWLRQHDDGLVTIGITDHAQALLGDVVFIELPKLGAHLIAGEEACVVESVKAASEVYCPVSGEVVAVNEALSTEPQYVNTDPYGQGWFFKILPSKSEELNALLDATGYINEIGIVQ